MSSFPSADKSMIGRRFSGGPFFFPGFGSGVKMPILSWSGAGGFPSFAVVFRICSLWMISTFQMQSNYCKQSTMAVI